MFVLSCNCSSISQIICRKLLYSTIGKLSTQIGGIRTTSMSISGLSFVTLLCDQASYLDTCSLCYHSRYICRSPTCFELNWPLKKDRSFLSHPKGWKRVKETHFYVISLSCNYFWVLSFFLEFSLTLKVVWSTGHFFTFTEVFIDYRHGWS